MTICMKGLLLLLLLSLSYCQAEIEPGMFCGLALDQDNQDDLTEGRIAQWTTQVMTEMNVKVTA